jgi:uncharacterized phage protein (TIGR01671 family)
MREIIFRGQLRRKGEKVNMAGEPLPSIWKYGGVAQYGGGAVIYQAEPEIEKFPVYADTVGQYTGLKDKHGVKVFEGDIVRDITEHISKEKKSFGIAVVKFGKHDVQSDDSFCYGEAYGWYFDGNTVRETPIQYYGYNKYVRNERLQFEVIGNIYDNPELLEEESK